MKPRTFLLLADRKLWLAFLLAALCISVALRSDAQTKFMGGVGSGGPPGSGTVTSVAATVPSFMALTGSPITTSGTLAFSFATQAQGTIFAAPCSGAGAITFRLLCAADIPALAPSKITGTAVIDSDVRLTNARTPTAHAATHAAAGSDPATLSPSQVTGTAVVNADPRLTDARAPTAHASTHASAGGDPVTVAPSQVTGTAVVTADSRLSDARTPLAHASTHAAAGADAVTITEAQVTGLVSDLAGKQASGNYIDGLTGDVVATGPGSVAATIQPNSVALGTDTTGGYAGSSTEGGAATTADALTANGTNCVAPDFARGVDASGNCEGAAIVASDLPSTTVTPGSYTTADITVDAQGRITAAANGSAGGGVTSLNSLTGALSIAAGTTGTDVNIAAAGSTVTVHVPDASATARGVMTTGTQTIAGAKTFSGGVTSVGIVSNGTVTMSSGNINFSGLTQNVNVGGAATYGADGASDGVISTYGEINLKPGVISSGTGTSSKLHGKSGEYWRSGWSTELITLSTSGTTSDSVANLLPANSILEGVACRVQTTITTATDWSVGDTTTAARFSSANATLTAGTTSVGLNHHAGSVSTDATGPTQASAAKLRITTTGTPGAGAVRCTVFYSQFSPPTS